MFYGFECFDLVFIVSIVKISNIQKTWAYNREKLCKFFIFRFVRRNVVFERSYNTRQPRRKQHSNEMQKSVAFTKATLSE